MIYKEEQNELSTENVMLNTWIRLKALYFNCKRQPIRFAIIVIYCILSFFILSIMSHDLKNDFFMKRYAYLMMTSIIIFLLFIILLWLLSGGIAARFIKHKMLRIGFMNAAHETPILLSKYTDNKFVTFRFYSNGIVLSDWQDNIPLLENILNISIANIETGRRDVDIYVWAYSGKFDYNMSIYWYDNYHTNDSRFRIGENVYEPVYVDLAVYPHILIGGATGSGKTWLLKHLLSQAIYKEYHVVIADFKGGIDYPFKWREKCDFINDIDVFSKKLASIHEELNNRLTLLNNNAVRNIDEYNKFDYLPRIIIACDELAEIFDLTGLSKEEKAARKDIEGHINSIARLGRAVGIHLILATQRPDADVLSGQIKSNITYRICGRADDVLSKIILDNTLASERVPKDAQGLFLNNEGILFKGYVFDENSEQLL